MSENKALVDKFKSLPKIKQNVINASTFEFAALALETGRASRGGTQKEDVATKRAETQTSSDGAISQLQTALATATSKLEFGKTPLSEWRSTVVFAGTRVRRASSKKTYQVSGRRTKIWRSGRIINENEETSDHWFTKFLMHRIITGGPDRHEHVVVGAQGCGKSTLLKYLISKNSEYIRNTKIVFSRFELLKYWKSWHPNSPSKEESLADYLSFIHARDLLLDRFFDFVNGNQFKLKFNFRLAQSALNKEISIIASEVDRLNGQVGGLDYSDAGAAFALVQEAVEVAKIGNKPLMNWLSGLSVSTRILLVGALWDDRTLVTIFDGMDSLRIEDAFQNLEQWQTVCHIIKNRKGLSSPTDLRRIGIAHSSDSIVVIRRNTAKFLEIEFDGEQSDLGLRNYYHVGEIDGLAALLSTTKRALRRIDNVSEMESEDFDKLVFDFMRIFQRTFIAIGRGHGSSVPGRLLYNFFDGNLRQLFEFISRIMEWSIAEMLPGEFLDSQDYFGSAEELIHAMASEKGNEFLRRKSYRVVDLLLSKPGEPFENAAGITRAIASVLRARVSDGHIRGNPDHTGFVDNILNYLDFEHQNELDRHSLLEKLRVVQILSEEPMSWDKLGLELQEKLGYEPHSSDFLIKFLLKTDFITAEIEKKRLKYDVKLRATSRGRLVVSSLIQNLSYIEQIFHKTLLPSVLISHISDKPRDEGSIEWASISIRNAYILLTYMQAIEQNRAKKIPVPKELVILDQIRKRIIKSIERMTRISYGPLAAAAKERGDARKITAEAISQIEETIEVWRSNGVLPASN